jgi:AbrB family looped-hinge helix DNA binding protein
MKRQKSKVGAYIFFGCSIGVTCLWDTPKLWEYLNLWDNLSKVGKVMSETTAKLDEKGRVRIPKRIREAAKLKEGSYVNIKARGKTIIIEMAEPVADKYYGAFKVDKWPEDMDEFSREVMQKWWGHRGT